MGRLRGPCACPGRSLDPQEGQAQGPYPSTLPPLVPTTNPTIDPSLYLDAYGMTATPPPLAADDLVLDTHGGFAVSALDTPCTLSRSLVTAND